MPVDIQKMSYESSVTIALLPSSFVNIVSSYMSQKNEILKIILGCIFLDTFNSRHHNCYML
jgi:hypothetical protein